MSLRRLLMAGNSTGGAPVVVAATALLNFNGSDGSTTFTDDTGNHTWSAGGNAQIDTAQSKWGTGSLLLDGSGDYITSASHADWAPGTGDFTVAGWVWQAFGGQAGDQILFLSNANFGLFCALRGGQLTLGFEGVAYDLQQASAAISTGAWHHYAICRAGTTAYGFIDGAQVFAGANTRNFAQGAASIGSKADGSASLNGRVDSALYIKGTALYTSPFTPPTGPYSM